jgi:tetratricopeptide (TPR) repeat protein
MEVLFALAEIPGQAVSLQQLMDAAWGDVAVAPESVYQAIAVLRRALARNSHNTEYIITVPKRGYRLAVPVTAVSLAADQEPAEAEDHDGGPGAKPMGRFPVLVSIALLLAIILFLARFLASDPEAYVLPRSVVLVASDDVAGSMADGLVSRLLKSDAVRLLTPGVSMYTGPDVAEQVLMARALHADFVINLRHVGDRQIDLSILAGRSGNTEEAQHLSVDYSDPEVAVDKAAKDVGTILGALPVSRDNDRDGGRSISDAARLDALGRYFMQRRFTPEAEPGIELDQASNAFLQATEADPDFVSAWTGLAVAQLLRSEYGSREDAGIYLTTGRAAIDTALAIEPDSAEAYAALGLAAALDEDYLAARATLERAVSLDPANPFLLRWLSRTVGTLGYYREAARFAAHAAEIAPFSWEVLMSAGRYSGLAGDPNASIRFTEAALDLDPGNARTINNLLVAYREAGQLDKAIAAGRLLLDSLRSSSHEASDISWAMGMVVDLYVDLGLLETAGALAVQAEAEYPAVAETVRSLVRLNLAEGDIESARRRIKYWGELSGTASTTAESAVYAIMTGMDEEGVRLLEQLPALGQLPEGSNPMLEAGRWLTVDFLHFASLPAVYRALLHLQAGESVEAQRLLDESDRFLDYWVEQGLSPDSCLYLRAAVNAMQNETDAGLEALSAAVDSGWRDAWRIKNDPALHGLRMHPGFENVLTRLEAILMTQKGNVIAEEARTAVVSFPL